MEEAEAVEQAGMPSPATSGRPPVPSAVKTAAWVGLASELVVLVYVVDLASDGAISRALDPYVARARRQLRQLAAKARFERDLSVAGRWVVWEAHEVLLAERDRPGSWRRDTAA